MLYTTTAEIVYNRLSIGKIESAGEYHARLTGNPESLGGMIFAWNHLIKAQENISIKFVLQPRYWRDEIEQRATGDRILVAEGQNKSMYVGIYLSRTVVDGALNQLMGM